MYIIISILIYMQKLKRPKQPIKQQLQNVRLHGNKYGHVENSAFNTNVFVKNGRFCDRFH